MTTQEEEESKNRFVYPQDFFTKYARYPSFVFDYKDGQSSKFQFLNLDKFNITLWFNTYDEAEYSESFVFLPQKRRTLLNYYIVCMLAFLASYLAEYLT